MIVVITNVHVSDDNWTGNAEYAAMFIDQELFARIVRYQTVLTDLKVCTNDVYFIGEWNWSVEFFSAAFLDEHFPQFDLDSLPIVVTDYDTVKQLSNISDDDVDPIDGLIMHVSALNELWWEGLLGEIPLTTGTIRIADFAECFSGYNKG